MQSHYLGKVSFNEALAIEQRIVSNLKAGRSEEEVVLGFESEAVITLGTRAQSEDLKLSSNQFQERGFAIQMVPRGGQATLHNPGQLIVFPVVKHAPLGAKAWVEFVARLTGTWLGDLNCPVKWDACRPGLYSAKGKIVAMGFRLRNGISTHGISINIHNDLEPFSWIRACGQEEASVDRLRTQSALPELFNSWFINFKRELTSVRNSPNLGVLSTSCARSSVG